MKFILFIIIKKRTKQPDCVCFSFGESAFGFGCRLCRAATSRPTTTTKKVETAPLLFSLIASRDFLVFFFYVSVAGRFRDWHQTGCWCQLVVFVVVLFFLIFRRNCNKKPAISRVIMTFAPVSFIIIFLFQGRKGGKRKEKKKSYSSGRFISSTNKALQGEEE